jgi:hypothetical protein
MNMHLSPQTHYELPWGWVIPPIGIRARIFLYVRFLSRRIRTRLFKIAQCPN